MDTPSPQAPTIRCPKCRQPTPPDTTLNEDNLVWGAYTCRPCDYDFVEGFYLGEQA
jgi:hypothetical protein